MAFVRRVASTLLFLALAAACGKDEPKRAAPKPPLASDGQQPDESGDEGVPNDEGSSDPEASNRFVIAALGDSITAALNVESLLKESRNTSWATGKEKAVLSHAQRFETELKLADARTINAAVSGATSASLAKQVDKVLKANYVTLLIGANDLCSWPAEHRELLVAFEKRVDQAVARLLEASELTHINLIALPDLRQLHGSGRTNESCQTLWDVTGLCPLLLGSEATAADRDAFASRQEDLNEALADLAERHGERIHFAKAVATAPFGIDEISSIDCFHPSALGQRILAQQSWSEEFAAKSLRPYFER